MNRAFRVAALIAVLSTDGCGPTWYINQGNPSAGQVEFDKDWYECRRENIRPSALRYGSYASAEMVVDEQMAKQCMAARGWRPGKKPN